jgi:hypothetical protein
MEGISAEIAKCFQSGRVEGIIPELLVFSAFLIVCCSKNLERAKFRKLHLSPPSGERETSPVLGSVKKS